MADCKQLTPPRIKETWQQQLIRSLAAWRIPGKADVTFVCGQRKFYAHKLVLGCSVPFFEAMFKSEQGSEIPCYLQPEVLDVILDFIYLGDVTKINTEELLKGVLNASRDMKIKELTEYCCVGLQTFLSTTNVFELWNLAVLSGNETLKTSAMNFVLSNFPEILGSVGLLELPFENLRDLLFLSASKLVWMDDMLLGLVQWLLHDLDARKGHLKSLVACVDERLISKTLLNPLHNIQTNTFQNLHTLQKMLGSGVTTGVIKQEPGVPKHKAKARITFFSEFYNGASLVYPLNRTCSSSVQQFDLATMMWLPSVAPCAVQRFENATVCQWENYVCCGGADEYRRSYGIYDLLTNSVKYFKTFSRPNLQKSTISYFKSHLYLIGGQDIYTGEMALTSVRHAIPRSDSWHEAKSLHYPRCSPLVLTSEEYIYVIGGTQESEGIQVECNYSPDKDFRWQIIEMPKYFKDGKFFIFRNSLWVLGYVHDASAVLRYDHGEQQWHKAKFTPPFHERMKLIFQFPGFEGSFVYISTGSDEFCIPTYLWEPETGKLTNLPPPSGKCSLAMVKSHSASVWTTAI